MWRSLVFWPHWIKDSRKIKAFSSRKASKLASGHKSALNEARRDKKYFTFKIPSWGSRKTLTRARVCLWASSLTCTWTGQENLWREVSRRRWTSSDDSFWVRADSSFHDAVGILSVLFTWNVDPHFRTAFSVSGKEPALTVVVQE